MRKAFLYIAFLLLFTVWLIHVSIWPKQLMVGSYFSLPEDARYKAESQVYLLNFPLSKAVPGTLGTYLPEYKPVSLETARFYSGLFGMGENGIETDEYYSYQNEEGRVYIYKDIGRLRYAAEAYQGDAEICTDPEEVVQKALQFIEENLLFLSYEESRVRFDGELYEVVFVNLLANIQNYAHPIKVILDRYGRVVTMDYYFTNYKKLGSCRVKTMWEAFLELPADFSEGVKIPLTQCRLVYFYENSVVQPAYLFEGTYPGDKSFYSFVKASVYD